MCSTRRDGPRRWWLSVTTIAVLILLFPLSGFCEEKEDIALWDTANTKYNVNDLFIAEQLFQQLVDKYPKSTKAPGAQLKLAQIKHKRTPADTAQLLEAFQLVRTKYKDSPEAGEALVSIGYLHSRSETTKAIDDLNVFLAEYKGHPKAAQAQQVLGRLYLRVLDLDRAEAAFDKVKTISDAPISIAEEAALQAGFARIMKYHATKDRSHLPIAIDALSKLTAASRVNVRARAELGIAESYLLLGKPKDARTKYLSAAQTYADQPYFRGMALYGAGCSAQQAGELEAAIKSYDDLLLICQGTTITEKDAAWKSVALGSTTPVAQLAVTSEGKWEKIPASGIISKSVFCKGLCMYHLQRYDDAISILSPLAQYLGEGNGELALETVKLIERCRNAKGGGQL